MIDLYQIIEQCAPDVAPTTMLRIIGVESAQNVAAIGYKITKEKNVFTLTKQPRDVGEAKAWATWLLNNGYRFDAGIAQVNSSNFAAFGLTPSNVFDPCTNIQAGSKILKNFYLSATVKYGEGQQALYAALSAYQSGNFYTGFSTGYVQKVVSKKIPDRGKIVGEIPPLQAVEVIHLNIQNDLSN